jgi:mono/diheme cytochrome c family protein
MTRARAWLLAGAWGVAQILAPVSTALAATASAEKGSAVFGAYCVACHGVEATGCGPRARLYVPRPANLTRSTLSPPQKAGIIRFGGALMGRSAYMPPWGEALTEQEIADLVAHLTTLQPKPDSQC